MSDERTPRPARVRVRGRDQDFSGSNGKLSVDELIALRNAGVTPEYINDMRTNSGFSELSLKDIYEMRMQGVTPKYLRDLRNSGIAIKTPHEATELRIQGVSPEYIAQIASAGYKNGIPKRIFMALFLFLSRDGEQFPGSSFSAVRRAGKSSPRNTHSREEETSCRR